MSLAAKMVALFGRRAFNISPAVSGKTTWDLANDGPLNLSTAGSWTITPLGTFLVPAKVWGAGAKSDPAETGGAGGYAAGYVLLVAGVTYTLYVGGTSIGNAGGVPGGGSITGAGFTATPGAGYSGLQIGSTAVLIAGGGGGHGHTGAGGAGGGLTGEDGSLFSGTIPGHGGTQSAGGAPGDRRPGPVPPTRGARASITSAAAAAADTMAAVAAAFRPAPWPPALAAGSGYANPQYVTPIDAYDGHLNTPGNSADSDRGSSGNEGTAGPRQAGVSATSLRISSTMPNAAPTARLWPHSRPRRVVCRGLFAATPDPLR
jgi:hypothetical protein